MTRKRFRIALASAAAAVAAAGLCGFALAAAAGSGTSVTVAGCLSGGRFSSVSVQSVPSCAATATPVQWAGQAVLPSSPSPTPTATSPSPSPTATSPSPSPTGTACVTSAASGQCDFGPDPSIAGACSNPWTGNNVWSTVAGWKQALTAYGPGSWQVAANLPAGNAGVVSYPNTGVYYCGAVDGYAQFTSSFTESMARSAQTSGWAMYDLWLNDWANEVMIQFDFQGNGDCTSVASAVFAGQDWHLCQFGTTLDWKLGASEAAKASEQSGTVDLLAMLKWSEGHGYLPAGSTWTAVSAGFELCSTGGADESFGYSRFTVSAS